MDSDPFFAAIFLRFLPVYKIRGAKRCDTTFAHA